MDGNDGNIHTARDALKAAAESEQIPGAADGTLGKNADQMPFLQPGLRFAQRFHNLAWGIVLRNRNRAHKFCQPMYAACFVEMAIHQKSDKALGASANQ